MVALRLIPCLDVANGRVVKGVNFLNLKDSGDPVELACKYSDEGADELVFLDIRATIENRNTLIDLVSRTAKSVKIPFTTLPFATSKQGIKRRATILKKIVQMLLILHNSFHFTHYG